MDYKEIGWQLRAKIAGLAAGRNARVETTYPLIEKKTILIDVDNNTYLTLLSGYGVEVPLPLYGTVKKEQVEDRSKPQRRIVFD